MVAMSEQTSTVQGRARATNVNLNMPARQAVQKINMPERSRGELDVDMNKIVKGAVDGIEDYQEKKVEKGLNNYAREVNKIAEGVRQGAFGADDAEGRLRKLDDIYLAQGYKAEDLGTIRSKYDGGVYTARSAVLKEKEMHEAKRRLEAIDTFRKTYKFASNWADERCSIFIDGINRLHDELVATNKALESPNMSAEDREAMTRVRNDQFERLGMENTMMQLNHRLENNQPLTAEEVVMFRQNFMAEARRNQIPLEVAAVMSDRMLDASGMSTIMELQKQNADNVTEYNKKITGAMIESSRLGQYRSFPQLVTLDAMSAEARKAYLETPEGENLLRIIGTSLVGTYNNKTKTLELPATSTVPVLMNVVTNATRQPSQYPATVLSNGISLTTDTLGQYNQDVLNNMSTPSDVKTVHYNMEALRNKYHNNPNVLKVVETMSPEQKKQFEKSGRFNMAISEWTALMPDFVLDAKKMFNSLGTSRLRVNDEGLLVMSDDVTGSAKGFWQTAGNILGAFHSDIDEHMAAVNEFLSANLESPEERKEFIKMISGGHDIPNAGTFEVTEDNYRSVTGNIGDIGSVVGGFVSDEAKNIWETDKALAKGYMNFTNKMGGHINKAIYEGYKSFDDFLQSSSINQKVIQEKQRKAFDNTVKKIDDAVRGAVNRFGEAMRGLPEDIDVKGYLKTSKDMVERGVKNALDKFTKEFLPDIQQGYKTLKEVTGYFVDDIKSGFVGEEFKRLVNDKDFKKALQDVAEEYLPMLVEPAIVNSFTDDVSKLIQEGSKDLGIIRDELKMIKKYTLPIDKANADSFIDSLVSKRVIEPIENTYLKAIIDVESAGDPSAVSKKGARGLMQIMPATWNGDIASRLGMTMNDIDDPSLNILGGYYYFSTLRNKYKDINKTLAAYNWGQGNVDNAIELYGDQWWTKLPEETFKYLNKVNHRVRQSLGQYEMFRR